MARPRNLVVIVVNIVVLVTGITAVIADESAGRPARRPEAARAVAAAHVSPLGPTDLLERSRSAGTGKSTAGQGATSTTAASTTTTQRQPWPPGVAEAEAVAPGQTVTDDGASGGTAVAATTELEVTVEFPVQTVEVVWRVKASGGRLTLMAGSEAIGEYGASGAWQEIAARLALPAGQERLAVRRAGGGDFLVDWISVTSVTPGYTVRGRTIRDPAGQSETFRGVNRNSLEVSAEGWWWWWGDAKAMQDWGANIVRIPLSQMFWLRESCEYDPRYVQSVDRAVSLVTSRGMVALLDLHHSSRGATCGANDRQAMPDALSVGFWSEVASRYAANPLVAFHLYNEPRVHDARLWRDGGAVNGWQAVGMQDLYDAVRSTGATNLVFVSGGSWGVDLRLAQERPLDGYNIVFAPQLYHDGYETLPGGIDELILGVAAEHPVVITEFGSNLDSGSYNAAVIDWAEGHGLGWIAWVWGAGDADPFTLLESWETHAPNATGVPVRDALLAHA